MNPLLKDKNGAVYTPEPIVNFMVESSINWLTIASTTEGLKDWYCNIKSNIFYDCQFTLNDCKLDIPKIYKVDATDFISTLKARSKGICELNLSAIDDIDTISALHQRLGTFNVLDPCCGGGNFTCAALHRLFKLDTQAVVRLKELGVEAKHLTSIYQIHAVDIDDVAIEICKRTLQMTWWECGYPAISPTYIDPIHARFGFYFEDRALPKVECRDCLS